MKMFENNIKNLILNYLLYVWLYLSGCWFTIYLYQS